MIDLQKLKEDTNKALEILRQAWERHAGVNYADLRCDEVRYILNDRKDSYYEVVVSEAAPYAYEFRNAIGAVLYDQLGYDIGKVDIEVVTEW